MGGGGNWGGGTLVFGGCLGGKFGINRRVKGGSGKGGSGRGIFTEKEGEKRGKRGSLVRIYPHLVVVRGEKLKNGRILRYSNLPCCGIRGGFGKSISLEI